MWSFSRIMLCQTPQAWCTIAKTSKPTVKAPPVHIWGSPHAHPGLPLYTLGLPLYTLGSTPVHIWDSSCLLLYTLRFPLYTIRSPPVPSHVLRNMSEPSRMPAVRVLCLLHLCRSAQVRILPRDNPKNSGLWMGPGCRVFVWVWPREVPLVNAGEFDMHGLAKRPDHCSLTLWKVIELLCA